MRICVAGAYGAFGIKHLDALAAIDEVTVIDLGAQLTKAVTIAQKKGTFAFRGYAMEPLPDDGDNPDYELMLEQAQATLEQLLEQSPDNNDTRILLARSYGASGDLGVLLFSYEREMVASGREPLLALLQSQPHARRQQLSIRDRGTRHAQ